MFAMCVPPATVPFLCHSNTKNNIDCNTTGRKMINYCPQYFGYILGDIIIDPLQANAHL